MNIQVVYVYPVCGCGKWFEYAVRFLESYHHCPPLMDHGTTVVCNGGPANFEAECFFASLPNCRVVHHDNSGFDIGAFQFAARSIPADMMVFFGASTYFTKPGWLARMVTTYQKHGNAQYGAMGNRGDRAVSVWPHIRTTAFWMNPALMNAYPKKVTQPHERHPFEHGPECFTSWVTSQGLKSWVVTWHRELEWVNWDDDPNGFQRGDQSSLLAGDHICELPYYPRRNR